MNPDEIEELRKLMLGVVSSMGWFMDEASVDAAMQLPMNKDELIALLAVCGIAVYYWGDDVVFKKADGRKRLFSTQPYRHKVFSHPLGHLIVMLHNQLTRPEWLDREFK